MRRRFLKTAFVAIGATVLVLFALNGSLSIDGFLASLAPSVIICAIGITTGALIYRKMLQRADTSEFSESARAYLISPLLSGLIAGLLGGAVGFLASPLWLGRGPNGEVYGLGSECLMIVFALFAGVLGLAFGAGLGQRARRVEKTDN